MVSVLVCPTAGSKHLQLRLNRTAATVVMPANKAMCHSTWPAAPAAPVAGRFPSVYPYVLKKAEFIVGKIAILWVKLVVNNEIFGVPNFQQQLISFGISDPFGGN